MVSPMEIKEINEVDAQKIRKELAVSMLNYRRSLIFLYTDAPISLLGLNKSIEKILLANGLLRIYDLLDADFTKIKGLGISRTRDLTAALNQFIAMC